jgi:hypothetical protein
VESRESGEEKPIADENAPLRATSRYHRMQSAPPALFEQRRHGKEGVCLGGGRMTEAKWLKCEDAKALLRGCAGCYF